ncbi:CBS domain-containing protein [Candidatus Poribacteria bacterium]|nr:CBS domain-containing protein [Candidatus Poribacteria bacterium]
MVHDPVSEDLQRFEELLEADVRSLPEDALLAPVAALSFQHRSTVSPNESIATAMSRMIADDVGCLGVLDGRKLVGILTERDVLMKVAPDFENTDKRLVSDLMIPKPSAVRATATIADALRLMHLGHFRHLPIVDDGGNYVAMVSVRSILEYVVEHFQAEVLNLPPNPIRGPMNSREGA